MKTKNRRQGAGGRRQGTPLARAEAQVVQAADRYEAAAVALSQAVMGVVDRNEHKAQARVDVTLEALRQAVRAWRLIQSRNQRRRNG